MGLQGQRGCFSFSGGGGLPAGVQGDILYNDGAAWVVLSPGTAGQVLETQGPGADPQWATPSSDWPTAVGADYAAVNYEQAQVVASNAYIALTPSGTGGLQAQVSDGTAAGGNSRGANAVDWQTVRSFATQVASGVESVVVGGRGCRADGFRAVSAGGFGAAAIGNNTYASGNSVTANANDSYCVGTLNLTSGVGSATLGGRENIASAQYSATIGGFQAVASHYGSIAQAAGHFAVDGDAQYTRAVMRAVAPDNVATILYLDGSAQRFTIPDNTTYALQIEVVAKVPGVVDTAVWHIDAGLTRGIGAGTTALVGAVASTKKNLGPSANTWTLVATADTTNGALTLTFTGAIGQPHFVVATVHATKVTA